MENYWQEITKFNKHIHTIVPVTACLHGYKSGMQAYEPQKMSTRMFITGNVGWLKDDVN